jgi:hypothetical protein
MERISILGLARHVLLSILFLALVVDARPRPKAAWVRGARSTLAKSSNTNKNAKLYVNGSVCHEAAPEDFRAPHQNVWSALTDKEAADVTKWLFAQKV